MTTASRRHQHSAGRASRRLAHLQSQITRQRALLARLQRDVLDAEGRLDGARSEPLVEANQALVLSMMQAYTDVETASHALQAVSRAAALDALTMLPNRLVLLDRFDQAILNARRHGAQLALLFLDLNNFKQINDTLGHAVGDEVLKLVARRLAASVRESDTVSRHGGDEFVILLAEVAHPSDAGTMADKLVAALSVPTRVGDHVLRLSASVGISVYPDDGTDAGTLIDRADAAMYRAKRNDEVNFAYHLETPGDVVRKSLLLASLQKPVARFELALAEHEQRHGQLREANEQLVLAALNAQVLQAAAERAQQRQMESLAVVAHELRNPLTPIRAAAALLGRPRTDEARLIRVKAMIERQVVHMSRLVEDLLDVSRVNTGKLRLQHEKVDMSTVIDAAIASCRPAMDTRLQRFAVHVPSEPIELYGDPVRLLQILSNVLDNASKYTPDGGEISLEVVLVGDSIRLTVTDNGIGITAEALPHIFAPFVQDSHAVGFNGGGLGIGLTVVQELVDGHGGSVVATSAGSGHGSEFVIMLPRSGGASNVP